MYCKDCKWRVGTDCTNREFIGEEVDPSPEEDGNKLSYSYAGAGWFTVGPLFGCVHFAKSD